MEGKKKRKIVLVDGYRMNLDFLKALIEQDGRYEVVSEISDREEFLNSFEKVKADVFVIDFFGGDIGGVDTAKAFRQQAPWIKAITLTENVQPTFVKKLKRLGVHGYVLKSDDPQQLFRVIETVVEGKPFYPDLQTIAPAFEPNQKKNLSAREIDIIRLIVDGLVNRDISLRIDISLKTVESHRTNIFRKLGVKNAAELIQHARKHKIV